VPTYHCAVPPNRFIGGDRLSDANEITLGLTTQAFSNRSGQRVLSKRHWGKLT
jgi:hypothetical protein